MTTTPDTVTGTARATEYPPRRKKLRHTQGFLAFWLLLPALLAVFGVVIYPTLRTLLISFFQVDSALATSTPFVGLQNYAHVLSSPGFWAASGRTLVFTIVSTTFELVFGMVVAGLLNARFPGRWLFRTIVVIPWAVPTIVNAAMWKGIFNAQYGSLNALLTQLHLIGDYRAWLGDPNTALAMVIVADVWKMTPLVAFFLLAGLTSIPGELYEAAKIDGASWWQTYRKITMPFIFFVMTPYLIVTFTNNINNFNVIYLLSLGEPTKVGSSAGQTDLLITWLYKLTADQGNFNIGAVIGILTFVVLAVVALITYRNSGSYRNEEGFR